MIFSDKRRPSFCAVSSSTQDRVFERATLRRIRLGCQAFHDLVGDRCTKFADMFARFNGKEEKRLKDIISVPLVGPG
jgi:hypothetical protein